ncbi:hypothetical protein D3C77_565960 [compost metagenome]
MHHTERKRRICSGMQRNEPIRTIAGSITVYINYDELCSLLSCLLDQRPHMHIRTNRVLSPYDEQLRLSGVLWAGSSHKPHRVLPAHITCGAANSLIQLR